MHRLFGILLLIPLLVACAAPLPIAAPTPQREVSPSSSATPTPDAAATPAWLPTPAPSPILTPLPAYTLSGTVFFDCNGNGLQDGGEPPITGIEIAVRSMQASEHQVCTAITDNVGRYRCDGVPVGQVVISVTELAANAPGQAFRYINVFGGWTDLSQREVEETDVPAQHLATTEVRAIADALAIEASQDTTYNIALMQGFLTLPFHPDSWHFEYNWVDLDPAEGTVRNYAGLTRVATSRQDVESLPPAVQDGHDAIDYAIKDGTLVYAAVPGIVADTYESDVGDSGIVVLSEISGKEYKLNYGHMAVFLVAVGDRVERGQTIAATGRVQELHFQLLCSPSQVEPCKYFGLPSRPDDHYPDASPRLDPFRDLSNPECISYWTVDNDPQYADIGAPQP